MQNKKRNNFRFIPMKYIFSLVQLVVVFVTKKLLIVRHDTATPDERDFLKSQINSKPKRTIVNGKEPRRLHIHIYEDDDKNRRLLVDKISFLSLGLGLRLNCCFCPVHLCSK